MTSRCFTVLFAMAAVCNGQTPFATAAVNSANYFRSTVSDFGVAQGSMFLVLGSGLGPQSLVQSGSYPLPKELAGVSVQVQTPRGQVDAIMIYALDRQVAAILPSTVAPGSAFVTVTYRGQRSNPIPVVVVPSSFGIYTRNQAGRGPGIFTDASFRLNALDHPARPGETWIIWGTGLGPVAGDETQAPLGGVLPVKTEVFVGNKPATVRYAGRSGCCAGLDQIAFDVPAGVDGCFVPVVVKAGDVFSNYAALAVAANGQLCSDPVGIPSETLLKIAAGQPVRTGSISIGPRETQRSVPLSNPATLSTPVLRLLSSPEAHRLKTSIEALVRDKSLSKPERTRRLHALYRSNRRMVRAIASALNVPLKLESVARAIAESNTLTISAQFGSLGRGLEFPLSYLLSNVSAVGSCSMIQCVGDSCLNSLSGTTEGLSSPLDAGPALSATGPFGTVALTRRSSGSYQTNTLPGNSGYKLVPGSYIVSGTGGRDIGAFSANLTLNSSLEWTNRASITEVNRGQDLTVTWNPSQRGYVGIGGFVSGPSDHTVGFICLEQGSAGSFRVASNVLSAVPGAHVNNNQTARRGYLFVISHPLSATFSAPGLDLGYIADLSLDFKEVSYR